MAEIFDRGDHWELVINQSAKPVENIDEQATKGYRATLGLDEEAGKHVVMDVQYDKSKYSISDVYNKVEQLRSCGRCSTLDKENLKVSKVHINRLQADSEQDVGRNVNVNLRDVDDPSRTESPTSPSAPAVPAKPAKNTFEFKDMFANMFFEAYLTKPGMYFLGSMLGDQSLIDRALPKSLAGSDMNEFMGEMVDFFSGEMEFFRTPEEAKEYLSVLYPRSEDDGVGKSNLKSIKKKKQLSQVTVIY